MTTRLPAEPKLFAHKHFVDGVGGFGHSTADDDSLAQRQTVSLNCAASAQCGGKLFGGLHFGEGA